MALTYSAIRTFAKAFMGSYVEMGFSSRMIQKDLISRFGKAYRFQNIQADIRSFTGMMKKQSILGKISTTTAVPNYAIVETELLAPYRYRVYAKLKVTEVETGATKEQYISFYDDERKSKDQWTQDFLSDYSDMYYNQNTIITSIDITMIEHDKRLSYG